MKCLDTSYQPHPPQDQGEETKELHPTHESTIEENKNSFHEIQFERSDSVVSTMRERKPEIAEFIHDENDPEY